MSCYKKEKVTQVITIKITRNYICSDQRAFDIEKSFRKGESFIDHRDLEDIKDAFNADDISVVDNKLSVKEIDE